MIIDLLQTVFERLNTDWRVYYNRAVGTVADPIPDRYIIYKLPPYSSTVDRNDRILEVTFWTNGVQNPTIIEQKVEEIDKRLRGYRHIDESHLLVFDKIGGGYIPDPDPIVERRELRYLIKQSERIDS
ncbi:MAG: hypothetical protein ABIR91_02495 [Candidatus Saccharimonadales bacterium]